MKLQRYEEYSPRVLEIYKDLSSRLYNLIPHARIDHIGSSAIPGSISKGDLDVLVAVEAKEFLGTLEAIKSIEFTEKQDTLKTNELCMLVTKKYDHDVAVQLIVKGSEFESFITFRDTLLNDSNLVEQYNDIKIEYSNSSQDEYREHKSKFISQLSLP